MLEKKRVQKAWIDEEIEFIFDNYDEMTYKQMAEALGRSERSVINKVVKLREKGDVK